MRSKPGVRSDLFPRPLDKTLLTDFFGGVSQAEVVAEEAIESHVRTTSTLAENSPRLCPGEKKLKAAKLFAAKLEESSYMDDGINSAAIRAWTGAGLVGLFVAWITISASRST